MIKYTKYYVRNMLRKGLREYETIIGNMTLEERKELREWVADGNSVNENPYLLYGDNGLPFDYITAIRINEDMILNPEDYCTDFRCGCNRIGLAFAVHFLAKCGNQPIDAKIVCAGKMRI